MLDNYIVIHMSFELKLGGRGCSSFQNVELNSISLLIPIALSLPLEYQDVPSKHWRAISPSDSASH